MDNDIRTEYPFYNPEKVRLTALKLGQAVKEFIDAYDKEMNGLLQYKDEDLSAPEIRAAYLIHGQKQATIVNNLHTAYIYFGIEMNQQERNKKVDELLLELKEKHDKQ